MHDRKCPRVRHLGQLHIFSFGFLAKAVLPLAGSPNGKKWSSPDQEPATRCAADISVPSPRKKLRITRSGADRIRSPVSVGRPVPSADRCPPVAQPLRPPTAVVRARGRCAGAGSVGRGAPESAARYSAR